MNQCKYPQKLIPIWINTILGKMIPIIPSYASLRPITHWPGHQAGLIRVGPCRAKAKHAGRAMGHGPLTHHDRCLGLAGLHVRPGRSTSTDMEHYAGPGGPARFMPVGKVHHWESNQYYLLPSKLRSPSLGLFNCNHMTYFYELPSGATLFEASERI